MSYDPRLLLDGIADFLSASGLVNASVGMPADPPSTTWASVHPGSGDTADRVLNADSSDDTTRVRIWRIIPTSATADLEYEMARLPYEVWSRLAAAYTLGGSLSIRWFGNFRWEHGEDEWKGVVYAITDISFTFQINDVASVAA